MTNKISTQNVMKNLKKLLRTINIQTNENIFLQKKNRSVKSGQTHIKCLTRHIYLSTYVYGILKFICKIYITT